MISDCSISTISARLTAVSVSTCSICAAGVPSSGENANAPTRSRRSSRRKSHSSANSSSPSPGRPVIRLVRMTSPGIPALSLANRAFRNSPSPRRFISFRILLLQCWMGMSRYLTIFGSEAMT